MMTILWLIAVILVIAGIYVILARRDLLWGIVLIIVGLLVGPGGVSIFT
ncbi:GPGG-motif small membrane protein [Actinomadura geliboluensis]